MTAVPHWLLQRRRRAEAALTLVVATCYWMAPLVHLRRWERTLAASPGEVQRQTRPATVAR
jgi:hypothetical protein